MECLLTPPKYTELSQQEYAVINEAYPHTVSGVINTIFSGKMSDIFTNLRNWVY